MSIRTLLYLLTVIFGWLLFGCEAATEAPSAAPPAVVEESESSSTSVEVDVGVGSGGYVYDAGRGAYVWHGPNPAHKPPVAYGPHLAPPLGPHDHRPAPPPVCHPGPVHPAPCPVHPCPHK
jgi:hypothetical protein